MADISDVEQSFVTLITGAIYPNGTSQPSAVVVPGYAAPINCRIAAGWPLPGQVDKDVAAGAPQGSAPIVNVSIYPMSGLERNTTRFPQDWVSITKPPCSMTLALNGLVITVGGAVTPAHFLTIHLGNNAFSYAAQNGDTIFTIAAALGAQMVAQGVPALVQGPTITVPAIYGGRIVLRSGAPGIAARELDRMQKRFCITIWAPNNKVRVAVAKIIRPLLARTDFLSLPDGYDGWLKYENESDVDRAGKQSVACRDFHYWVEYPTLDELTVYPMTTFASAIEADNITDRYSTLPWPQFDPDRTSFVQLSKTASISLSGSSTAAAAGQVTGAFPANPHISGVAATDFVGSLAVLTTLAMSGAASSVSAGAVSVRTSPGILGVAAVDAVGLTPITVFDALVGVATAASAGNVSVQAGSATSVNISGVASVASTGTVVVTDTIALPGSSTSDSAGSTGVTAGESVSGAAVADAAGSLGVTDGLAVSGASAADAAGSTGVTDTIGIAGAAVVDAAGTVTVGGAGSVTLTGVSVSDSTGTVGVTAGVFIPAAVVFAPTTVQLQSGAATPSNINLTPAPAAAATTTAAGTVVIGGASVPVSGAAASDSAGTASVTDTIAASGAAVSDASGTAGVTAIPVITGASTSTAPGSVGITDTINLSGAATAVAAGTVTITTGSNPSFDFSQASNSQNIPLL